MLGAAPFAPVPEPAAPVQREPGPRPPRVAVLFDGTWADADDRTSIALLHDRVAESAEQHTRYVPGVGTRWFDRVRGGLFGVGLNDAVRQGYDFVAAHHEPGTWIYLLGYSRGAFTARSLAGMIAKCGLPTDPTLTTRELFDHYRDPDAPGRRELALGDARARTPFEEGLPDRTREVRIRFVGVFETVGRLGVPAPWGALFGRRHRFHDTNLSGLVDHARHAIALDERRAAFRPTLWTSVPVPVPGAEPTTVEQRWFTGAHGNVGGGDGVEDNVLATLPREWMADAARTAGLDVTGAAPPADAVLGPIDPSHRKGFFGLIGALPGQRPRPRPVRHTNLYETLDGSVLRRWADDPAYRSLDRPPNPGLPAWIRSLAPRADPAG